VNAGGWRPGVRVAWLDLRADLKDYGARVSGYRIAELAERSGFTATALRYYEQIGLLEPPARTSAGYRMYDDAALERLAFVDRAKRMGYGCGPTATARRCSIGCACCSRRAERRCTARSRS
jgi:hypothetical protein